MWPEFVDITTFQKLLSVLDVSWGGLRHWQRFGSSFFCRETVMDIRSQNHVYYISCHVSPAMTTPQGDWKRLQRPTSSIGSFLSHDIDISKMPPTLTTKMPDQELDQEQKQVSGAATVCKRFGVGHCCESWMGSQATYQQETAGTAGRPSFRWYWVWGWAHIWRRRNGDCAHLEGKQSYSVLGWLYYWCFFGETEWNWGQLVRNMYPAQFHWKAISILLFRKIPSMHKQCCASHVRYHSDQDFLVRFDALTAAHRLPV